HSGFLPQGAFVFPAPQPQRVFGSGGGFIDADDPTPRPADVAVGFYLGTYAASARAFPDPNWAPAVPYGGGVESIGLFHNAFQRGVEFPYSSTSPENPIGPAFRRLVAAWLARRENPGSICLGLERARAQKIPDVLPTARVAAGAGQPAKMRAAA